MKRRRTCYAGLFFFCFLFLGGVGGEVKGNLFILIGSTLNLSGAPSFFTAFLFVEEKKVEGCRGRVLIAGYHFMSGNETLFLF